MTTATVSDISERIRDEGEKQLRKLDALTHPKKRARKTVVKSLRLGKLTMFVMVAGLAYGAYKFFRNTPASEETTFTERDMPARDSTMPTAQRTAVRTA